MWLRKWNGFDPNGMVGGLIPSSSNPCFSTATVVRRLTLHKCKSTYYCSKLTSALSNNLCDMLSVG